MWRVRSAINVLVALGVLATLTLWGLREVDISPLITSNEVESSRRPTASRDARLGDLGEAATYAEIVKRPLFMASRRPPVSLPPPEPVQPAIVAAPPPSLQLLGVLLHPDHKRALIASPSDPGGRWIDEGSDLGGMHLKRIGVDGVTLTSGTSRIELQLERR